MAIHYTTHHPKDTCGCVFEYSWDDEEENTEIHPRTHTFVQFLTKCKEHDTLSDIDAYNSAVSDNVNKNNTVNHIKDTLGIGIDNIIYSFTGKGDSRVLNVTLSGMVALTLLQKTEAQSWADTNIGAGKVLVS